MKHLLFCSLIAALPIELFSLPQASLKPFGLENKGVGLLATPSTSVPVRQYLYATTAEGVFRRDLSHPDSVWVNLGLAEKIITAIDIQVWGDGPAILQTPIVVVGTSYPGGDSIPIYRLKGQTWLPADSGIKDGISSLASFSSREHEPRGAAFAAGISAFIFRSNAGSTIWTEIHAGGIGPGFSVLRAHQTDSLKEIWVGGFDSHSYLALVGRLNASGEWLPTSPFPRTSFESACYDFAFHPANPRRVYAAVSGAILRTDDGGANWQFTGLRDEQTEFYSLCSDHFNPGHLFAVGASHTDGLSKFWESRNDGETWQEVPEISALSPQSMRLLADPKTAGVVYIATAHQGVWKYQSQAVSVAEREGEFFSRDDVSMWSYPNPFNAGTRISFSLPKSMFVKAQVFDASGRAVAVLHEGLMAAATYHVNWDGRNHLREPVMSGVYFCRLETAAGTLMRKMLLLR